MTSTEHVALVSGGSRGIGAAVCHRLARDGVAVLVAARGLDGATEVADSIRASGGVAWPLQLDVTDAAAIPESVARARELAAEAGPIDWLVNNAGISESAPLLPKNGAATGADALFQRHLDTNFHGARYLTEELVPQMVERGYGRVVNVASSAGIRGYAYVAAYCASKFALIGYTLAAADELAQSGVTFNGVCPHYVDSPMLDRSIQLLTERTGKTGEQLREFFRTQNPGGRILRPEEVADAVAYLLYGDANGALLEMDGSDTVTLHRPNLPEEA